MRSILVKEDNGQVLIDLLRFDRLDKSKYNRYEFFELVATRSSDKITIQKGAKTVLKNIPYTEFQDSSGDQMAPNSQATVDELNAIFRGKTVRDYKMNGYTVDTSFSGDVSYIEFPSSPYGGILDNLTKETVCFGDLDDSVRGDGNTIEVRGLSSGSTVSYEVTVQCNVDAEATFTFSSPSGQFSSSSYTFISLNTQSSHVFSGSASITNNPNLKLFGSIDCEGGGTYRISDVKITVTR